MIGIAESGVAAVPEEKAPIRADSAGTWTLPVHSVLSHIWAGANDESSEGPSRHGGVAARMRPVYG